jgi:P27 family predicted phage terminase small subunit
MATRGRPPDPIPLKILKGRGKGLDVAGYRIPDPPVFNRGAPDPPDWLTTTARELWDRIAPGLDRLDLLKPEDYTSFVAYCETWSTYLEALEQVRAGGLIVSHSKTGMQHKNPAVSVLENAGTQLLRFAQQFGLTPSAEVALARPGKLDDTDDPFAGPQQQQQQSGT